MTKIIWMSDPHFQNAGLIDDLDPRIRLATALDHANTHHADADFIVMSGDLVGDDIAGDYSLLAQYLTASKLPVHAMVGNNDDRNGFRQHMPLPDGAMPDFIQYALATPEHLIVCLDTHKVGSHAGAFCPDRQAWLHDTLGAQPEKPAYIFMHHPPLALGLPAQDTIMLDEADALLDLIAQHPNVRHLFMGHVHRTTSGTVRGIPFASLGALSFQAPAPRPAWDWDSFKPPAEPPQYAVVLIEDGNVVIQYTPFCAYEVGVIPG